MGKVPLNRPLFLSRLHQVAVETCRVGVRWREPPLVTLGVVDVILGKVLFRVVAGEPGVPFGPVGTVAGDMVQVVLVDPQALGQLGEVGRAGDVPGAIAGAVDHAKGCHVLQCLGDCRIPAPAGPDDVGGDGGEAGAFDRFVDEGGDVSQSTENGPDPVYLAAAPGQIFDRCPVLVGELDEVEVCFGSLGVFDLAQDPVRELDQTGEKYGRSAVVLAEGNSQAAAAQLEQLCFFTALM